MFRRPLLAALLLRTAPLGDTVAGQISLPKIKLPVQNPLKPKPADSTAKPKDSTAAAKAADTTKKQDAKV